MLEKVPGVVGHALQGVRPGPEKLVWADEGLQAPATITVTSAAFSEGERIPAKYTADGPGVSPPIAWKGVPANAASVVLIVEDPDSPTPLPFMHLMAFGLPAGDGGLAEGALPGPAGGGTLRSLGRNTFRKAEYLPPDPPTGHGPHHYVFQVYALDRTPDLKAEAEKHEVVDALRNHVVARGKLVGVYEGPAG